MSVNNPPAAALSSGLTAETMGEGDFIFPHHLDQQA